MISKSLKNIKQSLSGIFERLTSGAPLAETEEHVKVSKQDLRAFVTNEPVAEYHRKMPSALLAHRWAECAKTLSGGLRLLNERETHIKGPDVVRAMNDIARIIEKTGDFEPDILLPIKPIATLSESHDALCMFKFRTFIPGQKSKTPNEPGNIDTLYFKAAPLFAPYTGNQTLSIPKNRVESVVLPLLNDLGIDPNSRNAPAQGWEKLGEILTSSDKQDFAHADARGTFILRTCMLGMAYGLCKTPKEQSQVTLPTSTVHGIEFTLHHVEVALHDLHSESRKISARILETARTRIIDELSPWFSQRNLYPGNIQTFGD